MRNIIALISLLALSSCQTEQQTPQPKTYPKTKDGMCMAVHDTIRNPWTDARAFAVAMEVGRNYECFGKKPPQEVKVIY